MKQINWLLLSCLTIVLLLVWQVVKLTQLYRQLANYRNYWQQLSREKGEFVYLALGDSAAQGIGASRPQNGYVGLLANRAAAVTGKQVQVVNLSVSGAVIQDVIEKQLPQIKGLKPNLVTIEIGANDMAQYDHQKFAKQFEQLVSVLPPGTFVANMPYFQTRPARRASALDATNTVERLVAARSGLTLVDLQTATKQRNDWRSYAADWFHPNDRSYRHWADAFWEKINGQL